MTRTKMSPRRLAAVSALLALALWPLVVGDGGILHRVLGMALFYGALAFAWNINSLTGAVSLGHAAFFGLGAYGSALANHYWHWSPLATIPLGGIVGSAYSLVWIAVFGRLRGAPFALASFASVQIPAVIIDNWDSFTFGSSGVVGLDRLPSYRLGGVELAFGEDLRVQYYLLFVFMLGVGWLHRTAIVSRWGWAVRAIREDEVVASSVGVDAPRTRAQALYVSALLTGLCGGLYAHLIGLVEPSLVFSLHISAVPLVLSIFGGRHAVLGPLVGALILYPADQLLFHSWLPVGHGALYGLVVVMALLFFPRGVIDWTEGWQRSS